MFSFVEKSVRFVTPGLVALVMAVIAFSIPELATARECVIGSGQTSVLRGNILGSVHANISKRPGEMLSNDFEPDDLTAVPHVYMSQEVVPFLLDEAGRPREYEYLRYETAQALMKMLDAARGAGIEIALHSAHRKYRIQCSVFNRKLRQVMAANPHMTESQAIADVNKRSALPGQSEHQLGTAVDLVTNIPASCVRDGNVNKVGYKLEQEMDCTPAFRWLQLNAHRYGFVLSYPSGAHHKAEPHPKTGFIYEPWHWRYIGAREAMDFLGCHFKHKATVQDYLRWKEQQPSFTCPLPPAQFR